MADLTDAKESLNRLADRALAHPQRDRIALLLMFAAAAIYAALALWLTRGVSYSADDLTYFQDSDGFSPGSLLEPHNGHLQAVTRFIHAAAIALVGPDFIVIRLAMVIAVGATALLLFVLLRERLGGPMALALSVLFLFLGSSTQPIATNVAVFAQATAFGLGAFVALGRQDLRGDLVACGLLVLAVLSFEVGVAFAVGVAALILLRPGGLRRSWVFLVPAVVYGSWWIWSQRFDDPSLITLSNILLIPSYAASSLAAAGGALAGLSKDFAGVTEGGSVDISWGRVVAVIVVAVLVRQVRRVGVSPFMIACFCGLVVLWTVGALSFGFLRTPLSARYLYPVALLLILILAEAFRGTRVTSGGLLATVALVILALGPNLSAMRSEATGARQFSAVAQTQLAMVELEGDNADQDFDLGFLFGVRVGLYQDAVQRNGSFTPTPDEVAATSASERLAADGILSQILTLELQDSAGQGGDRCTQIGGDGSELVGELPAGGAVLRSESDGGVVELRRFADEFTIPVTGKLRRGELSLLPIPVDPASTSHPWSVSVSGTGPLTVCAISPAP